MSDGWWRAALALVLCGVCNLSFSQAAAPASALARGQYLARIGNCVSCHSRPGGNAFAGGVAFETPFGRLYSTNITQDPKAGIGLWTPEQFTRAMRDGVRPDGSHLYPVFPYVEFTKISDSDLTALYAFIKTIAPSSYAPPPNALRFPYNQRWALGLWKAMYFTAGRFTPKANKSAEWNRGAYLVEGLGHCGECHTPRGMLGGQKLDAALTGAVYRDQVAGRMTDWSSVNLTSAPSGLASWSTQEITDYLRLGLSARAGTFGPMNEVIMNSTRYLAVSDAKAIAVYLKSLPGGTASASAQVDLSAGETLYGVHCGTCHLPTGLGGEDTGPPLAGSAVVQADDPASLINISLFGERDLAPSHAPSPQWDARKWQPMNPFADKLADDEMAALLTFVRASFGNHGSAVTAAQVAKQR